MRTNQNLHLHEFIGLDVKVVNSSSHEWIGVYGKVVDETKNLLVIECPNKKKILKIPKIACTFMFTLENGEQVKLKGSTIVFRPEERTKKEIKTRRTKTENG